jgi:fructose-1,6-bisphosphatase/inositol monophosphatase family enzyme
MRESEKKGLKTLRLSRETLRSLGSAAMARAIGAAGTLDIACYTYRCQNPTLTAGTNCCQ